MRLKVAARSVVLPWAIAATARPTSPPIQLYAARAAHRRAGARNLFFSASWRLGKRCHRRHQPAVRFAQISSGDPGRDRPSCSVRIQGSSSAQQRSSGGWQFRPRDSAGRADQLFASQRGICSSVKRFPLSGVLQLAHGGGSSRINTAP